MRARTSHVNAKGKRQCIPQTEPQAEQQLVSQPASQSSTQAVAQEGAQNNFQQVKTIQKVWNRVQNIPLVVQGNMCKKCKDPIAEKKYVSIGTQTDLTGEIPLPRKNVEIQGKEVITSTELGQNLIQLAPMKRVAENTKPFLIYKKINDSTYNFYDGKTSWNGSSEESEWIMKASTGGIIWHEKYEGPAQELDYESMYPTCMSKSDVLWPIYEGDFEYLEKLDNLSFGILYHVEIEGQPEMKKNEKCTRLFRYNPEKYYTHYDIERAKGLG
ncbi:hypothetical protein C1646_667580 [Rhizophagus diaphanus]|nr:hypothetical protein C1646_667580 [Rhizophagus diaphanus] [Rhizophagus sp. MUCL 43196]